MSGPHHLLNRRAIPPLPEPAALYRRLLAALGAERCPLCAVLHSAAKGPEVVSAAAADPGAACAPHRRRLAAAAPATPALLHLDRERLTAWRTWLGALREARPQPWRRLANLLGLAKAKRGPLPGGPRALFGVARRCPACRWLAALDRAAGRLLLDSLDDLPVRERFAAGRGLCAPHLEQLHTMAPLHRPLDDLLARQASAVDLLEGARQSKPDDVATAVLVAEALDGPTATADASGLVGVVESSGVLADAHDGDVANRVPGADQTLGAGQDSLGGKEDDPAELRLELARLRARLDDVEVKWQADRGQLAAIRYRLWEVSEDRKRLEMNLAGAEGEIALLSRLLDRRPEAADGRRPPTEPGAAGGGGPAGARGA